MPRRADDDDRQPALDLARQILDGRTAPVEGAQRLAHDLLPPVADPRAAEFAEAFAEALALHRDDPATARRVDERIRHVAWRVVTASI
jgi:hypothetical protein